MFYSLCKRGFDFEGPSQNRFAMVWRVHIKDFYTFNTNKKSSLDNITLIYIYFLLSRCMHESVKSNTIHKGNFLKTFSVYKIHFSWIFFSLLKQMYYYFIFKLFAEPVNVCYDLIMHNHWLAVSNAGIVWQRYGMTVRRLIVRSWRNSFFVAASAWIALYLRHKGTQNNWCDKTSSSWTKLLEKYFFYLKLQFNTEDVDTNCCQIQLLYS